MLSEPSFIISPLSIIYTLLDIRHSDTIPPTGRWPTKNESDISPRRQHIKKVEKSSSIPFRKRGSGEQEVKEAVGSSPRERGWPGYNHLLQDRWQMSPTMVTELIPIFVKVSPPMELNNSEGHKPHDSSCQTRKHAGFLLLYFTPTTNVPGISIGRIHSCDRQQALVRNVTIG